MGAGSAVVFPVVTAFAAERIAAAGQADSMIVTLAITGVYPALIWSAFLFAGMAIGRLDLRRLWVRFVLFVVGIALTGLGFGGAWAAHKYLTLPPEVSRFFIAAPHSGTPLELIGSGGLAMAIIGFCLLISQVLRWVLFPLAATGSLALTVFVGLIVGALILGPEVWFPTDNTMLIRFIVVAVLAATIWRLFFGSGPLERLVSAICRWAGKIETPTHETREAPEPEPSPTVPDPTPRAPRKAPVERPPARTNWTPGQSLGRVPY
jgi:hypothetical protein